VCRGLGAEAVDHLLSLCSLPGRTGCVGFCSIRTSWNL
jgi:hypothetical protein